MKKLYFKKMTPKYTRLIVMLLLCSSLFFAGSCKKEAPEAVNKPGQTLFQYISASKDLSMYRAALAKAGLLSPDTLGNGPFTVFAPVDSAFAKAGLTLDKINAYDAKALGLLLKYMIVKGELSSSSLIGFYSEDANALNAVYLPRIIKNYYGIFYDGIPLQKNGSITLADGVIQKLTRVDFPPTGSLWDKINSTPNLTLFAATLKVLGFDQKLTKPPGSGNTYDEQNFYTVFAPSDDAFKKIGYPDVASINNADPSELSQLLLFNIDNGKFFTCNMIGGFAMDYNNVYVATDGFTIISTGNVLPTHIIQPDILGQNGVLQIVDQVFVVAPTN